MSRERVALAVICGVLLLLALGVSAQEAAQTEQQASTSSAEESGATTGEATSGIEFDATVEFALSKSIDLHGSVGEVEVRSVEFEAAKPKGAGITNPMGSSDPAMQAVVTTRLQCASTAETKTKLDIMVEFLDKDGQIIDRAKNSDGIKNGQKTFEIKHTTLKWALDHVVKARITVEKKQ